MFYNQSLKSLHPTRKGINLSSTEFSTLVNQIPSLENKWSGLKELPECSVTHYNEMQQLRCNHCTPSPNQNDKEGATRARHEDDLGDIEDETTPSKASKKTNKRKPVNPILVSSDEGSATEEDPKCSPPLIVAGRPPCKSDVKSQAKWLSAKKSKLSTKIGE